jgi:putative transferase (TIGR04331 family)
MADVNSLVVTADFSLIKKEKGLLLLKPHNNLIRKYSAKLTDNPHLDRRKLYKKYNKCETIYNKILPEISNQLNLIHQCSYNKRFWEIILGKWLKDFIYICEIYNSKLEYIKCNYNLKKIYNLNSKNFDFSCNDTLSLFYCFRNEVWFYCFIDLLIKNLSFKCSFITSNPTSKVLKNKIILSNSFCSKIIYYLGRFLSFFCTNNQPLIINSYLPFFFEKSLEIKNFRVPQIWDQSKISYSQSNTVLRSKIKLNFSRKDTNLERFIKSNVNKFLPKYVLENFSNVIDIARKKNFPKKPKFILTAASQDYDEAFKFYCAEQVNKRIPLYIMQHGNNIFSKIDTMNQVDLNYCDKYFSWGFSKKPKIIPIFNFKVLKYKNFHPKNKKNLLIVFDDLGSLPRDYYIDNYQLKQFLLTIDLISELKNEIKKDTILRLKPTIYLDYYGTNYQKNLLNMGFKIDNGKKNINTLYKSTKLCIFNYDSTGMLENFLRNIPSIIFVPKKYLNFLTYEALQKYKILLENNLMFFDKKKLLAHVFKNWNDIESWWLSKNNQAVINNFNKNFNVKPARGDFSNFYNILHKNIKK